MSSIKKQDNRDLEEIIRQDLGLLEWQIRDLLLLLKERDLEIAQKARIDTIESIVDRIRPEQDKDTPRFNRIMQQLDLCVQAERKRVARLSSPGKETE